MSQESESQNRISEVFLSFAPNQIDTQSFHSLDDEVEIIPQKKKDLNDDMNQIELQVMDKEITQEKESQELQPVQRQLPVQRLIFRGQSGYQAPPAKPKLPINITFLYLEYVKENPGSRKYLIFNIFIDTLIRLAILAFFIFAETQTEQGITLYFVIFVEIPRVLHTCTSYKLLFMDQYRLGNRSFLPMSHLYRINFIEEELPREEDLKPINYQDQILSFSSICFILMPIELSFIPLPIRNRSNMVNTLLISNYILKSIEVILFEPALVIFIVFRFMENNIDGPYVTAIFILVIVDMGKYVLLNVYLIIFSSIGKRNKVSL